MKFTELKVSLEKLQQSIFNATGRSFVEEITVAEPNNLRDELNFIKLVSWCYVLLFEAGATLFTQLGALAINGDANIGNEKMRVRQDVQNIRTKYFHNLPKTSTRNEKKHRQAEIWLRLNGKSPVKWCMCCKALMQQMADYIALLTKHWNDAIETEEDRKQIVQQLVDALEKKWPAHKYDRVIEEIACELHIEGLDIIAYRNRNLNNWQQITSYFSGHEAAMSAIRTTIYNGLVDSFKPRTITVDDRPNGTTHDRHNGATF